MLVSLWQVCSAQTIQVVFCVRYLSQAKNAYLQQDLNSFLDLYSSCLSDKKKKKTEALKSSYQPLVRFALVRQNPNPLGGKHRSTEI